MRYIGEQSQATKAETFVFNASKSEAAKNMTCKEYMTELSNVYLVISAT